MLKISTKLTLWYLVSTAVIIIAVSGAMYTIYDYERRNAIDEDLRDYANVLISEISGQSSTLSEMFDKMLFAKTKPQIKTVNTRFILSSNDSVIWEQNSHINVDSLLEVLEKKKEFNFKDVYNTIKLDESEFRTYSKPIDTKAFPKKFQKAGFKDLTLTVLTPLDRFYDSLELLKRIILIIIPFSIAFSGLIGLIIARRAFAPVRDITQTAAEISSHNLEKRVPRPRTNDELSNLADTLNAMITRLDATFRSQQRFIADASHDIRTPLTIIQMELELLISNDKTDVLVKENLTKCLKETHSLNKLAENLMLLARADSGQLPLFKKIIRLDEFVLDCAGAMNKIAQKKNVTFRIDVDEPIEAQADYDLLKRAFLNLLENAIKFSPENGLVTIKIDRVGNKSILTVNNKGSIIPDDLLPKVFDRFYRGDKSRTTKGFGLGLSIAKAVVDAHEGKIYIESDATNGTMAGIILYE